MLLTIGMATYDDFEGVYFTLHSLKLNNDLSDCELLVVDSKPEGCQHTKKACADIGARYIHAPTCQGTSAPRERVFTEALGDFVMCIDCHVLIEREGLIKFKEYIKNNLNTDDLLQGPLLYDDHKSISTHFEQKWGTDSMFGVWATDLRGYEKEPFEIPMQGLGLFAMRKASWPGFNRVFRGFGGEEGYLHEKVRQRGNKALCLPWLKWIHRFVRPRGVPYPLSLEDRFFNYVVGRQELGLPMKDVMDAFKNKLSTTKIIDLLNEISLYDIKYEMKKSEVGKMFEDRKTPCISLGQIIDRSNCNCAGKFVHQCEKHEKARRYYRGRDGIKVCLTCENYDPA